MFFFISIRQSSTTKIGKAVILKFQIAQHSRDTELIKSLITRLECGRIDIDLTGSMVYFGVTRYQDILEKIIALFDKYPIQGVKALDYI